MSRVIKGANTTKKQPRPQLRPLAGRIPLDNLGYLSLCFTVEIKMLARDKPFRLLGWSIKDEEESNISLTPID